ncbi:uncharacterized protein LOC121750453 [Salvia splendens]|uniref:uncharacterized protein LOC121750453 n=1 Tax=Salvia splendens TaxID=180675 RepID=UPI001C252D72|nr:uncharacterized protein LOC121750453 [Salvia splendens]
MLQPSLSHESLPKSLQSLHQIYYSSIIQISLFVSFFPSLQQNRTSLQIPTQGPRKRIKPHTLFHPLLVSITNLTRETKRKEDRSHNLYYLQLTRLRLVKVERRRGCGGVEQVNLIYN